MRVLITGGAGFIGSHCVDLFTSRGVCVVVYDNFSSGRHRNLAPFRTRGELLVMEADVRDASRLAEAMDGCDLVVHCAANPDISRGFRDPSLDFERGTVGTFHLLNAARASDVRELIYLSGSGVYGDRGETKLAEDAGPLLPVSMYGASKLACEGLVSAFAHNYGMRAVILRPANVVGPRQSHGVLHDFLQRLRTDPRRLEVLGDGGQVRSYVHVSDLMAAMSICLAAEGPAVRTYNVAAPTTCTVRDVARIAAECMGIAEPDVRYGTEPVGWVGDVPEVRLDCGRLHAAGWRAAMGSQDALREAARSLIEEMS